MIEAIAISPDGQWLAADGNQTVKLWSVPDRKLIRTFSHEYVSTADIAFSPDSTMLALASGENVELCQWSTFMSEWKHVHSFPEYCESLIFSPDGAMLAFTDWLELDALRIWSTRSLTRLFRIDIHARCGSIAWSIENLAIGSVDGTIQLWRVRRKADYTPENPSVEVSCQWSTDNPILELSNAQVHGVTGLDPTNIELLKQRGAIGEPASQGERFEEIVEAYEGKYGVGHIGCDVEMNSP